MGRKKTDETSAASSKEVIQSYMLTTAGRNWSLYAEKFLLKLVEIAQCDIEGLDFRKRSDLKPLTPSLNYPNLEINAIGDAIVSIPVKDLLPSGNYNNYEYIRKAVMQLQKEVLSWTAPRVDSKGNIVTNEQGIPERKWTSVQLIEKAYGNMDGSGNITVRIDTEIWKAMVDFSKGFRAFDLTTAMKLQNKYSLRLYQLLSRQSEPISFTLEELKKMWQIEKQYKKGSEIIRRIIEPAKAELDSSSPWTFDYVPIKTAGRGRPAITGITFIPTHQPWFENSKNVTSGLVRQHRGAFNNFGLTKEQMMFLKTKFRFTDKEIENNSMLFSTVCKSVSNVDVLLDSIAERASRIRPNNTQGYLINALKKSLAAIGIDFDKGNT